MKNYKNKQYKYIEELKLEIPSTLSELELLDIITDKTNEDNHNSSINVEDSNNNGNISNWTKIVNKSNKPTILTLIIVGIIFLYICIVWIITDNSGLITKNILYIGISLPILFTILFVILYFSSLWIG